jgi:hypothetical protein
VRCWHPTCRLLRGGRCACALAFAVLATPLAAPPQWRGLSEPLPAIPLTQNSHATAAAWMARCLGATSPGKRTARSWLPRACTDYECSTPVACHCDQDLFLCIWKQVKDGIRCEHPGLATICIARLSPDDCYRVGTHTPDEGCVCTTYCADPDTGWSWTPWMGDRYRSCFDNNNSPGGP